MNDPERIDAFTTRERVLAGDALLVCAYAEPEKFRAARLEGAIGWPDLAERLPELARDAEIIVYCA